MIMSPELFMKSYSRKLEEILNYVHNQEAKRITHILEHGNHYELQAEMKHGQLERFAEMKMLLEEVIRINNLSGKELTNEK